MASRAVDRTYPDERPSGFTVAGQCLTCTDFPGARECDVILRDPVASCQEKFLVCLELRLQEDKDHPFNFIRNRPNHGKIITNGNINSWPLILKNGPFPWGHYVQAYHILLL